MIIVINNIVLEIVIAHFSLRVRGNFYRGKDDNDFVQSVFSLGRIAYTFVFRGGLGPKKDGKGTMTGMRTESRNGL